MFHNGIVKEADSANFLHKQIIKAQLQSLFAQTAISESCLNILTQRILTQFYDSISFLFFT